MRTKKSHIKKSDVALLCLVVVPWVITLNALITGGRYFYSGTLFFGASAITLAVLSVSWGVHHWIGTVLRRRFPREEQTSLRLGLAIPLFILITALIVTLLFWGYPAFRFPGAAFQIDNYRIALLLGAAINVFVTFVHEALQRFEKWRIVLIRNEQLKKEYLQSQLLGLKSQINPHFLFNSLNSLSSLIHEDEGEAELFLNEMSKVYRYLLRHHEEELVPLQTEIEFIQSFFYLLKTRHGRAIELHLHVGNAAPDWCLPPLTLQMLLEDVFFSNAGTREHPVRVTIEAAPDALHVQHNLQRKRTDELAAANPLENIQNKFWLLCQKEVQVTETAGFRTIVLPRIVTQNGRAA